MGSAADLKHLYNSKRWKQLRKHILDKSPYCQCPHHNGKQYPANVVDHKIPHRGNLRLFWDVRNLQSMAKVCHDKFKQSQEKGGAGFKRGCDEHGNPLSTDHEWWEGSAQPLQGSPIAPEQHN
jgi:hypothetical protein